MLLRRLLFIRASLCLLALPFCAHAQPAPESDFYANSLISARVLQKWYNSRGLWNSAGWWNSANSLEAVESVLEASNGQDHLAVVDTTFKYNSHASFLNEFYDDEGWWAEAWIRAFDLTGEPRYLAMAKTIFADMQGGWDNHCGGGTWWSKERRYKNAIANELFLLVAIRLHQRTPADTGPNSYLDWAQREWSWFKQSGMINAQNLVNDGLTDNCENNQRMTWTYNQGVVIGGLVELYKSTGETGALAQAIQIADAATKTLVAPQGVLCELTEHRGLKGNDVPQFKGIFMRHLAALYDVSRKPEYRTFLVSNANSIWLYNRDDHNRFGGRWGGPIDKVDAIRQTSAMRVITSLADPITANIAFIKPAGSPAFRHEVGSSSGTAAWKCAATALAGYALISPESASLPAGSHILHCRLSVSSRAANAPPAVGADGRSLGSLPMSDSPASSSSQIKGKLLAPSDMGGAGVETHSPSLNLSNRGATLARLEVLGPDNSVRSSRPVAWNEFTATNQPHDFSLAFTNSPDKPLVQFRLYWNAIPGSPELIISDLWVDAPLTWSAANLAHAVGQLDGFDHWCADPIRNKTPGFLVRGPGTTKLPAGEYDVCFELKVDNFNLDDSPVATISVVDADSNQVLSSRQLHRGDFKNTLYHTFRLRTKTAAGQHLSFCTFWPGGVSAPRLTQRCVLIKPADR